MTEFDAVESLVALSKAPITPVRSTKFATRSDPTPTRSIIKLGKAERVFTATGFYRRKPNLIHVFYQSNEGLMLQVPLAQDDTSDAFNARRQKTADELFTSTRKPAYCNFKGQVVNVTVFDPRWVLYRESWHQKRYQYLNTIQLVVNRVTCSRQVRATRCRNCANPHRRSACQAADEMFYVFPFQNKSTDHCNRMLEAFQPVQIEEDISKWTKKMPLVDLR